MTRATVSATADVTGLLAEWSQGSEEALRDLIPIVYAELRRLAGALMKRERPEHTLQPTALVNEVYLSLVDQDGAQWHNRAHFFAVSAQLMRRILVDHVRSQRAQKRGGGLRAITLNERIACETHEEVDLVALDDALNALALMDPRQSRVVELRFFGGLTIDETAHVMGVSPSTVKREWRIARIWLYREMSRQGRG